MLASAEKNGVIESEGSKVGGGRDDRDNRCRPRAWREGAESTAT